MISNKLLPIAVATLVLLGGVAAVGAATPAEAVDTDANTPGDDAGPSETPVAGPDETPASESTNATADQPVTGNASTEPVSVGPPGGLPDRVSEIHETIEAFHSGDIGNLGEALQTLFGQADDSTASDSGTDETERDDEETADEDETENETEDESEKTDDEAGPPAETPGNGPK